ncbi:hypothetical protein BKA14_001355 [Actinoplanes abujensis]|uniref:Uncharacterized protein n=1 Tax=Paractinoplanes abujensis TaxID=882441 RepID=A0A7W7G035_9ACTN|nr:hypothetical protein [Actinoplanes abujensis]
MMNTHAATVRPLSISLRVGHPTHNMNIHSGLEQPPYGKPAAAVRKYSHRQTPAAQAFRASPTAGPPKQQAQSRSTPPPRLDGAPNAQTAAQARGAAPAHTTLRKNARGRAGMRDAARGPAGMRDAARGPGRDARCRTRAGPGCATLHGPGEDARRCTKTRARPHHRAQRRRNAGRRPGRDARRCPRISGMRDAAAYARLPNAERRRGMLCKDRTAKRDAAMGNGQDCTLLCGLGERCRAAGATRLRHRAARLRGAREVARGCAGLRGVARGAQVARGAGRAGRAGLRGVRRLRGARVARGARGCAGLRGVRRLRGAREGARGRARAHDDAPRARHVAWGPG